MAIPASLTSSDACYKVYSNVTDSEGASWGFKFEYNVATDDLPPLETQVLASQFLPLLLYLCWFISFFPLMGC